MIVHAHDALCLGFGLRKGRKEHAGKNCNDGDDYEKLNECKRRTTAGGFLVRISSG